MIKMHIEKTWKVGRVRIAFRWRSPTSMFGRFGGGWDWKIGVEAGSRAVRVSLLVCSVQIDFGRRGRKVTT